MAQKTNPLILRAEKIFENFNFHKKVSLIKYFSYILSEQQKMFQFFFLFLNNLI